MRNLFIISLILCLSSCSYINKKIGLQDDNILEETAEAVLDIKTGINIDFTPHSKE